MNDICKIYKSIDDKLPVKVWDVKFHPNINDIVVNVYDNGVRTVDVKGGMTIGLITVADGIKTVHQSIYPCVIPEAHFATTEGAVQHVISSVMLEKASVTFHDSAEEERERIRQSFLDYKKGDK